jgi:TorA maturation chaperone TorD
MSTIAVAMAFDPAVSVARQALYRFAALAMLDPKAGSWSWLDSLRSAPMLLEAAALVRSLPEAAADPPLAPGERPLEWLAPERVLERLPASADRLNHEYERAFGLLVANGCPPYETEFIDGKLTFQRSNSLADISGYYRAFGLELSRSVPERADHIVQELEFMSCLIGLERQAAATSSPEWRERQQVCRSTQAGFVEEHLAWWSPVFAELVSREHPHGFYAAAATFLAGLIPAERALLGLPRPRRPAGRPATPPPDACGGCGLEAE